MVSPQTVFTHAYLPTAMYYKFLVIITIFFQ